MSNTCLKLKIKECDVVLIFTKLLKNKFFVKNRNMLRVMRNQV